MSINSEQLVTIKCLHHNVPIDKQMHIRLLSLLFRKSEWDSDGIPVDRNLLSTHEASTGNDFPTSDPAVTHANSMENLEMPFTGNRRVDWADPISTAVQFNHDDPPLLAKPAVEPAAPPPNPPVQSVSVKPLNEGSEPGHCPPRSGYNLDPRAWADRRNQQGAGHLL